MFKTVKEIYVAVNSGLKVMYDNKPVIFEEGRLMVSGAVMSYFIEYGGVGGGGLLKDLDIKKFTTVEA